MAQAGTSPSGSNIPRPAANSSAAPPTDRLARHGSPHAIPSSSALDIPSPCDDSRKASDARSTPATSDDSPRNLTLPSIPSRAASASSRDALRPVADHHEREAGHLGGGAEQGVHVLHGVKAPDEGPQEPVRGETEPLPQLSARLRARGAVGRSGPLRWAARGCARGARRARSAPVWRPRSAQRTTPSGTAAATGCDPTACAQAARGRHAARCRGRSRGRAGRAGGRQGRSWPATARRARARGRRRNAAAAGARARRRRRRSRRAATPRRAACDAPPSQRSAPCAAIP